MGVDELHGEETERPRATLQKDVTTFSCSCWIFNQDTRGEREREKDPKKEEKKGEYDWDLFLLLLFSFILGDERSSLFSFFFYSFLKMKKKMAENLTGYWPRKAVCVWERERKKERKKKEWNKKMAITQRASNQPLPPPTGVQGRLRSLGGGGGWVGGGGGLNKKRSLFLSLSPNNWRALLARPPQWRWDREWCGVFSIYLSDPF